MTTRSIVARTCCHTRLSTYYLIAVMTTNSVDEPIAQDVVEGQDKPYRLWCRARTEGNPNMILVHGADFLYLTSFMT